MPQFILLPYFLKQAKRLLKKYPDLKEALTTTFKTFDKRQSDNLGRNIYKIRLTSRNVNRGKSKPLRLIALLFEMEDYIIPITIYSKGTQTNITTKETNTHLCMILYELRMQKLL